MSSSISIEYSEPKDTNKNYFKNKKTKTKKTRLQQWIK